MGFSKCILVTGILIVSMLSTVYARVETATVVGTITLPDGKAVVNVVVKIAGKYDFTDVVGKYNIRDVPLGVQTMQIIRKGTVLKEIEINVNSTLITQDEVIQQ